MTGVPTSFNSRFKLPNHPAGMTGRPISQLAHKQGKLFEGFSSNLTETRLGLSYVALRTGFGWRRLNKGEKPVYIMDDPGRRTPERDELGNLDQSQWSIGSDGTPLDPWARFAQIDLVREEDGCRLIFETNAPTAVQEVEDLVQRICWIGREKGPQASPIIVIDARQSRNNKGQSWWVPTFTIIGWTDESAPAPEPIPKPNPAPASGIDVTPEPRPSAETKYTIGGAPPAPPRPRLTRDAYQHVKQPEESPPSLAEELDDEILF